MNPATALQLLRDLGAPIRLLRHVELVGEAADALLGALATQGIAVDGDFVRAGVALHESAGAALLLARGGRPSSRGCAARTRSGRRCARASKSS